MILSRRPIIQRLVAIIENELPIELPSRQVSEQANLRNDLGLDSVLIMNLIGAIEQRFGIEFDESDLEPATFETIDSLVDVILKRLA